ncbi:MAG: hypothetical protein ACKOCD_10845 [Nitrospiraceae bacterium]
MSTDRPGLSAGTLIDGARMYAAAADAVNEKFPNALHVLSHLLGISIELTLKAYLRHHGSSVRELRRLGHDLGAIYERAQQSGLTYTGSRNFRLRVLGANYKARAFAYPEESKMVVIEPWSLRQVAHDLIINVFSHIKGERTLAELADQPGLRIASHYAEETEASAWAMGGPEAASEAPKARRKKPRPTTS